MFNSASLSSMVLILALIANFILDLLLPLGISCTTLYIPIIILNIRTPFPAKITFYFCTLVTVLVFIAYNFETMNEISEKIDQFNRILSVIAIWVVGWLCHNIKVKQLRLDEAVALNHQKDVALLHQSRLAGIGEMIGYVAHQWRQPLTSLHLIMFNIKDSYDHDELNRANLETALANSKELIENMSQTIDDFRDFFRPTHHERERESVAVVNTIHYVMKLVVPGFKQHRIDINLDFKSDALVLGYRNEFSHVIMNLLKNSKDAIKDNAIEDGYIWISTYRRGGDIVIECQDNGGGISSITTQQIFEPYYTTKASYGTGIGLYMSRIIIHDHMNGNISADNVITPYGAGACIQIAMPVSEEVEG